MGTTQAPLHHILQVPVSQPAEACSATASQSAISAGKISRSACTSACQVTNGTTAGAPVLQSLLPAWHASSFRPGPRSRETHHDHATSARRWESASPTRLRSRREVFQQTWAERGGRFYLGGYRG